MIKAIIIDDEKKSRELLSFMLKEFLPREIEVVGLAENLTLGLDLLRQHKPGLVFLDIELGGESGFDFIEMAPGSDFDVIFTTAYNQYAVKAFKYSAVDYLLKPIEPEELQSSIRRLIKKMDTVNSIGNLRSLIENLGKNEEYQQKITLPTGNAYEVVNIKEIIRCEADGSYTNFILSDGRKIIVSNGLKFYEDLLPVEHFFRVHHHHLVNINHVVRYLKMDGGYAIMTDNSRVELSRRKKDAFLFRLNKL
jgi:two-component system LytT family response regulator